MIKKNNQSNIVNYTEKIKRVTKSINTEYYERDYSVFWMSNIIFALDSFDYNFSSNNSKLLNKVMKFSLKNFSLCLLYTEVMQYNFFIKEL